MNRKIGIAFAAVVFVVVGMIPAVHGATASIAANTDWNQWRGPDRNGVAPAGPKLADAWGPTGPVLVWKSEEKIVGGPKKGGHFSNYGSPVVARGKVYLYVHDQAGAADLVYCLDADSGKTRWTAKYPGSPDGGGSCTPLVAGGKVFAVGTMGMYCLDAETGKEAWKTPRLFLDATGDGINTSPALAEGVLVVCAGSGKHLNPKAVQKKESAVFKGFDPATGKELWSCPQATADAHRNGDSSASVAVWKTAKGPRLITSLGQLTCLNPKDGSVIWQDGGDVYGSASTPAILGDLCVLGTTLKAYRLGPGKAEELFPGENGVGDRCGSYLLHDSHIYADCAGQYRCLDLTGKVLWQKSAGGMISSPVLADGKIFHVVSSKEQRKVKLAMFRATSTLPETFHTVDSTALQFSSPAINGGKLFLRLEDGVACYDLTRTPADVGAVASASAPAAAPAAKGLITFMDVSPSYFAQRKGLTDQSAWPPEKEGEAAKLDWAFNQPLDANGAIDFVSSLDARGMMARDCVVYARVVLEAAAPGKIALALTPQDRGSGVTALAVWVNSRNILRHDAHEKNPARWDLVVDLAKGKNTLLVRDNSSGGSWKLQVDAKPLGGLAVKQVPVKAPVAAPPTAVAPVATPAPTPAKDWPCFRGGTGGVSGDANTSVSWNVATGEGVLWKADLPLPGTGSPIVSGGRVLVSGASKDKAGIFCFDLKSGRKLWQGDVNLSGKSEPMEETTHAAPTPVTDGRQVYAVYADGTVAAFSLDGKAVWTASLGLPQMSYGYASSPALYKNRLLIQFDQDGEGKSALIALDTATGKEAWRAKRSLGPSWASPLVMETAKGPQIIIAARDAITAHDPKDGHEIWIVKKGAADLANSPVPAGDKVVVTLGSAGTLAIRTDGAGDVTATHVAWENSEAGAEVASPVVSGGRVFVATGAGLVCLNAVDGKQAEKSETRELGGQVYASPLLAGDKLYVVTREGTLTVFKAASSLNMLGKIVIGEPVDASPAVANGHLLIRTARRLLCIRPAPGAAPAAK